MKELQWLFMPFILLSLTHCRGQEKPAVKNQNEAVVKESKPSPDAQQPAPRKVVPWKDAKIKYLPDPKGNKFRIIEKNNGLSKREEGIEYLDASDKVTKAYDLRYAPFAPKYLKAAEKNDETTLRMESTWIEAKNMTIEQKKEALRPKYATAYNIKNLSSVITAMSINYDDREDINDMEGHILVEYQTSNYVDGTMASINSRIVILDSIGNTVDIIDDIPYTLNQPVLSADLRYVCYGYSDFMATGDDDEAISPTGIRLFDRKSRKNVIDKYFTPDHSDYSIPTIPYKIGNKIILACNGNEIGEKSKMFYYFINADNKNIDYIGIIRIPSEQNHQLYYGQFLQNVDNKQIECVHSSDSKKIVIHYRFNRDFKKMTFAEFNQLKFTPLSGQ